MGRRASQPSGVSVKWLAGRESIDHVVCPSRLVVRHHVTSVPDQQHGERPVGGRETSHFCGGVPDCTRRVPELLSARPSERPGHIHRASVRHDHVQLSGVEEHTVPAGVQKFSEPRCHGQRYIVLHPLINRVYRRPLATAHVQRGPCHRALHVPVPVAALKWYRVPVPHHVVDGLHFSQLTVQRRRGDHHTDHRIVRGNEIAGDDPVSGQILLLFKQSFAILCNDINNMRLKIKLILKYGLKVLKYLVLYIIML